METSILISHDLSHITSTLFSIKNLVNCINNVLFDIDFTYESKFNGERYVLDHFVVPEIVFPLKACAQANCMYLF